MWNEPTEKELEQIPKLYDTENIKLKDKIVYMHFFLGGSDWYIVEYDDKERLFFGYAILNDDDQNAEWGYISFDELINVKTTHQFEVDRDLYWEPKKVSEIDKIK